MSKKKKPIRMFSCPRCGKHIIKRTTRVSLDTICTQTDGDYLIHLKLYDKQ